MAFKTRRLTRRQYCGLTAGAATGYGARGFGGRRSAWQLATFAVDVTVPLGHPLMGGGIRDAMRIEDPLQARGFVLLGGDAPWVVCVVDWCEIRNDAYLAWRSTLARAAATDVERVWVAAVHQHDAPIADLAAQRLLEKAKAKGRICDLGFHAQVLERLAGAVQKSLQAPLSISHIGVGKGEVRGIASNRRYTRPDGQLRFDRTSSTRDAVARQQPEGLIDPWLRALSFWDGAQPRLVLSVYATHPMSSYGQGSVSADFVGLARARRQAALPNVFQIYASGCSGNVTAGKFNDGTSGMRRVLADRLQRGMQEAFATTRRFPLERLTTRCVPLHLEPRTGSGFSIEALEQRLRQDSRPFGQCLAALGLSWRNRLAAELPLTLPVIDLGPAQLLLFPGETYVEYQLACQAARPAKTVFTLGYGECATGYIPTDRHFAEHDSNLGDWCWVAPGSEARMREAIRQALAD